MDVIRYGRAARGYQEKVEWKERFVVCKRAAPPENRKRELKLVRKLKPFVSGQPQRRKGLKSPFTAPILCCSVAVLRKHSHTPSLIPHPIHLTVHAAVCVRRYFRLSLVLGAHQPLLLVP